MVAKMTKQNMETNNFLFEELETLNNKVADSQCPDDLKSRLKQMVTRLNRMAKLGGYSGEYETVSRYVTVATSIPWGTRTKDNLDLKKATEVLESNHHGLADVKERILELGKLGLKSIMYAGEGEPFLHKDIAEIVNHTKKSGIDAAITTNGVLFTKDIANNILSSTQWIKIGIEGAKPDTYAKIHKCSLLSAHHKGNVQVAFLAIPSFRDLLPLHRLPSCPIPV